MLKNLSSKGMISLIGLGIFIVLLPIALHIDYLQNDEWIHYGILNNFLNHSFNLHPLTAPTFYSIGFLALIWSNIFGVSTVPVLTLLTSIGCFVMLSLIINEHFQKDPTTSVILGLLLFVNPLFVFTSWGFMTDNYFLLFLLISVYFLLKYKEAKNFLVGNLFIIISYFARQLGLVTSLSFATFLILKKDYKKGLLQLVFFVLLTTYHFFLFPKTSEMLETKFEYSNFLYFRFMFSFLFIVGVYLITFLLPLALSYLFRIKRKELMVICLVSIPLVILCNFYFKPTIRWREDFYYLIYTVQQNGFFTENIHGIKPTFPHIDEIYLTIETIAKFILVATSLKIIADRKKLLSFPSIYIVTYLAILLISAKIYDRYLIPLLPMFMLFMIKNFDMNRKSKILTLIFILVLGFYSYNFEADYMLTNSYIWNKAKQIVVSENVKENQITATDAWRYLYPRDNEIYKFTYDNEGKGNYKTAYSLVEKREIDYPLNIWGTHTIYLYKLKSN